MFESLWVSAGTYSVYGTMFVVTVVINRRYGTAELGKFGIAWAAALVTGQAAVSGFSAIHRRDVAYAPERSRTLVGRTLALRLASLGCGFVGACLFIWILDLEATLASAILITILAKSIEFVGTSFSETLQVLGQNRIYALLTSLNAILFLGATWCVTRTGLNSQWIYIAMFWTSAIYSFVCWRVFRHRIGPIRIGVSRRQALLTFSDSWPLIINAVVAVLASRLSVLLLGASAGETAAGVYTFAAGIVGAVSVLAGATGTVLFPQLCSLFVNARHRLRSRMYQASAVLAAFGAVLWLCLELSSGLVVRVYGTLPSGAEDVLLLLGCGLIAGYGIVPCNYMFTAIRKQVEGMVFAAVNLAVVGSLLLASVPKHGALGAAFSIAISQYVMWIVAIVWLDRRHLRCFSIASS